jgi:NAD-dependent DNA ligase
MTEIEQPIEEGQHYEHTRGQIYTVDYLNDDIVLLYDGENYRLEELDHFAKSIDSGLYKLKPDLEISTSEIKIPFEEIDHIGEKANESLEKAGLFTPKDFSYRNDESILELEAVGETGLENIKEWIENNKTDTIEL